MRRRLLLALALAATSAVPVAHADEPVPAKAKRLASEGRAFHDAGDYPRAIVAFQEAYVLAPSPALLFNLAQAYRLQGNCEDAAYMYRRFLASEHRREARVVAEGHLDTVERCMRKRGLGIPMGESMAYLAVPAPPASPAAAAVGDDHTRRTDKQKIGIGLVIGGGIALSIAAVDGLRESGDDDTSAIWLAGGGAVAAATGVTLYLLGRRESRATTLAVAPSARGGAVITAGWRF